MTLPVAPSTLRKAKPSAMNRVSFPPAVETARSKGLDSPGFTTWRTAPLATSTSWMPLSAMLDTNSRPFGAKSMLSSEVASWATLVRAPVFRSTR